MIDINDSAERHLKFHRRQWIIYLMACTAIAVGTIIAVLMPGDNPRFVIAPAGALFGIMIVLALVERVRRRTEFQKERKRIWSDEWTVQGMRRAHGLAMMVVIFGQVPLMFFMAYVPLEPSVAGMGGMTVALGCGAMAAGFLYHTRAGRDE
jgi:hypothetical protein